jgi:hypothetical protein
MPPCASSAGAVVGVNACAMLPTLAFALRPEVHRRRNQPSGLSIMSHRGNQARRQFLQVAARTMALPACTPPSMSGSAVAQPRESDMVYPLVPFATTVDSWDHHWFMWLPHHPVHESVEIASREPDRDGGAAVWVWFTERAGSKRQVHYRNDPRLARLVGGNHCPIAYHISGDGDRPRSVQVRFDDIDHMPVEIDVAFDPDQTLTRQGAGLTDQSGHISDRAFLVFHRDRNALARAGRACIGPRDYAFGREDAQGAFPFRWSYSHGISIGLIFYNSFKAAFGSDGYVLSPETTGLYVLTRPWGGSVSLLSDQSGRLREYVDRGASGASLGVVFDPPLPSCGGNSQPQSSSFSISIGAAVDVVKGSVAAWRGAEMLVLEWRPAQPIWASRQRFRSEISGPRDHSLSVAVAPVPPA